MLARALRSFRTGDPSRVIAAMGHTKTAVPQSGPAGHTRPTDVLAGWLAGWGDASAVPVFYTAARSQR